jgi:hypothetical protein
MPLKSGAISEAEFTTQVVQLFQLRGWMVVHIRPAKTAKGYRTPYEGDPGLPDIIASRRGRTILAELKVGKNKPTQEQREWLDASSGYLWYPSGWSEIEAVAMKGHLE